MSDSVCVQRIAERLSLRPEQVTAVLTMHEQGASIPFIARYRKDATGNLDESSVASILSRLHADKELSQRKTSLLELVAKHAMLSDALREKIEGCNDKAVLDDLFAAYRRPRSTKAAIAIEKGLQPLADYLMHQAPLGHTIISFAETFARPERSVSSPEEAIEGAQHVIAERVGLSADAHDLLRKTTIEEGRLLCHPTKNAEGKKTKFEAYYAFSELLSKVLPHRYLGILRGAHEGMLRLELVIDDAKVLDALSALFVKESGSLFEPIIKEAVKDAYARFLRPLVEREVLDSIRKRAEDDAIRVFCDNLRGLLLAPHAGSIVVMGIEPNPKGESKGVVVGRNGDVLEFFSLPAIEPGGGDTAHDELVLALIEKHDVRGIALGNDSGARAMATRIKLLLSRSKNDGRFVALVSSVGMGSYAGSKLAKDEIPDGDTSARSVVFLARKLQDPLRELCKVDPRHLGIGQFQHDINQKHLREAVQQTIESCVCSVGIDLNTVSANTLKHVSGLSAGTASAIVQRRESIKGFRSREQLKEVEGMTARSIEQCAGFLKVFHGDNPLDSTFIHPETYEVVERIAQGVNCGLAELHHRREELTALDLTQFATLSAYSDTSAFSIGEFGLADIRKELLGQSRAARGVFKIPRFLEGVNSVADLREGMETEGVVSNITDFGAFVDIGVEQDGLVHISQLTSNYLNNGRPSIRVGEIVRVKVIKVDKAGPKISLSMRAIRPHRPTPVQRPKREPRSAEDTSASRPPHREVASERPYHAQDGKGRRERPDKMARLDKPLPAGRDDRGPREGKPSPRRDADRRPKKGQKERIAANTGASRFQTKEEAASINTLLADQLAALRDKFSS